MIGIAFSSDSLFGLFLWFVFAAGIGIWLLIDAVERQTILEGIKKITDGELEYKIRSDKLKGSNKVLAEAINNIGEGLLNAVDESVRNERLKTDLITNVSHDIKTPLTSIINYVDLLKRENMENEKVKGYIDILDQKSQRLKNLTEDLVEASKISSGNIKLEINKINFVELINQTEGEFSEKFAAKGLQVIKTLPNESVTIEADGRRIWRVIENLYNNVAKYAMENTRVYMDLKVQDRKVEYSIKNISEHPLNINADELTERFIRGDVSRSTEGSGLGLSIAKNLTTLQNGTFEIYLDGDLFKVTITFPRVD
jgi:signal transduction histidine kinase